MLDYAQFIAPQGDPIYVADLSQTLIQIQEWAANPEVTSAFVATVLVTENLADLNRSLVENPYSAKIRIPLPAAEDIHALRARPRARRGGVRQGLGGHAGRAGRQAGRASRASPSARS